MDSERAYHDTYYVVAHLNYAITVIILLIAVLAIWRLALAWWPSERLEGWRWPVIGAYIVGAALVVLPPVLMLRADQETLVQRPWVLLWTNRLVLAGSVLTGLAALVTFAIFILSLAHRIRR